MAKTTVKKNKTQSFQKKSAQATEVESVREISPFKIAVFVIALMFVVYLFLVFIWKQTSPQYPPINFLDLGVRTPVHQEDWLKRRVHGL